MLCSASELGLSEDSDGLAHSFARAKIGAPIGSFFPKTRFSTSRSPRTAAICSATSDWRGKLPRCQESRCEPPNNRGRTLAATGTAVQIARLHECPFYSARRIENVTVGPSPDWLRAKLEAVGLRSINNIVDITNFVMLELGQPLHAFDADKLQGGINVRLARANEKFLALDGKTYSLSPENLRHRRRRARASALAA